MLRCLSRTIALSGIAALSASAAQDGGDIYHGGFIGQILKYRVREGESLLEIGRRFDLGFNEVTAANIGVDPYLPGADRLIIIPTAFIPPPASVRPSLVVNLAELRLYFFPADSSEEVLSFPIGIGDEGTATPLGTYIVERKTINPSWHVPASMLRQRANLPSVVPPGPSNPLGTRAMHLSAKEILIHGTNRPWGIGMRSSHGCIRLYPEDIVRLFDRVASGTQVRIINRPIKLGVKGCRIFLEVHGEESGAPEPGEVLHQLARLGFLAKVDLGKVVSAVSEKRGYPVEVTSNR